LEAVCASMPAPPRSRVWSGDGIVIIVVCPICKNKKQRRGIKRNARNNTVVETKAGVSLAKCNDVANVTAYK
jgi:hypothetical protein